MRTKAKTLLENVQQDEGGGESECNAEAGPLPITFSTALQFIKQCYALCYPPVGTLRDFKYCGDWLWPPRGRTWRVPQVCGLQGMHRPYTTQ